MNSCSNLRERCRFPHYRIFSWLESLIIASGLSGLIRQRNQGKLHNIPRETVQSCVMECNEQGLPAYCLLAIIDARLKTVDINRV